MKTMKRTKNNLRSLVIALATGLSLGAGPVHAALISMDYLIVGGGGAGGRVRGGGGGAGGFLTGTTTVDAGTFTVVVGVGALGDNSDGRNGQGADSVFDSITALGGGRGGRFEGAAATTGGSGGGGGGWSSTSGANGTTGQGNAGGNGTSGSGGAGSGAGGGGAGIAGSDAVNNNTGGVGGDGLQSAITGTMTWYAGGGGGMSNSGGSRAGGLGGGGQGASAIGNDDATSGAANTGGGGGGAGNVPGVNGGDGGSGIVILRYEGSSILLFDGVNPAGIHSSYFDGGTTYQVHQFLDVGETTFVVVPEPGTLVLLGIFGLAMIFARSRKRA